jgi:hypothetical protein
VRLDRTAPAGDIDITNQTQLRLPHAAAAAETQGPFSASVRFSSGTHNIRGRVLRQAVLSAAPQFACVLFKPTSRRQIEPEASGGRRVS